MKIEVKIDPQYKETTVFILTEEETEDIDNLIQLIEGHYAGTIAGFQDNRITVIDQNDIIRIYSENRKIIAQTENGLYFLRNRLYELEQKLVSQKFIRISNSEIINIRKVKCFDLSVSGTIRVMFCNGNTSFVSRRYVGSMKKALGL